MPKQNQLPESSPQLFFDTVNAYQRTAAIKAAIELDLFTALAEGNDTVASLADKCQTSKRGARILCDYLVVIGFLSKQDGHYRLTPDSALFLDRRSPAYVGVAIEFLLAPMLIDGFNNLTAAVRQGGTAIPEEGTIAPEHPVWVHFARAMAPLTGTSAHLMAKMIDADYERKLKVLDIAAGHGMFGIAFAQQFPNAEIIAQDWSNVLEVAKENAEKARVAKRYSTLPGSAFEVDFGGDYDIILLTNFLHHFDAATCVKLLQKVHTALAQNGKAVTLEFVPDEDRVSPPVAAGFCLVMLASTPQGDAYTFAELESMFQQAGFSRSELHQLPPTPQQVVISEK
ncbi:MAG: methyltransferase domain-containing protein [Pyrinomonadaceae bacterium MAG19_C2-C3]|nr:methyltransferase domain-containing protein [Pyrinomonadaceae bacterium MAG19_C2-C3]